MTAAAEELHLAEFAAKVASTAVECRAAIEAIKKVAPIQALSDAALNYEPAKGLLSDFLLNSTKYRALNLCKMHGENCIPVSDITLEQALHQEAGLMATGHKTAKEGPNDALEAFREVLRETETSYTEGTGEIRFKMLLGPVGCECFIVRRERSISLFLYSPIFVPTHRQGEVAEALVMANWETSFGGFEMDHEDGQVRFHYSLPTIAEITAEHARMMLSVATGAMRRYAAGICELALTDHDPHGVMIRCKERDEAEQQMMKELEQAEAA